ncbi:hypothetical protein N9W41_00250 [bacterium]|nr:hypothetical protein [bacterium]
MEEDKVNAKMLQHLDLLMNMDILEEQEVWEELLAESNVNEGAEND